MRMHRVSVLLATLACCTTVHADIPADLDLVPFASGLDSPLAVRHAGDGSGRVYVVLRSGVVATYSAGGVRAADLLDISTLVETAGEGGLLGLAFHPQFPADPRVFVHYTDARVDSVVAGYATSGNPPLAIPGSAEVLLRVDQDFDNHNGGDIHFGPDGYLYIALGDGGSGNDPCNRAQTLDPADLAGADSGGSGTNSGCAADDNFLVNGAFPGNPDSRALLGKLLRIDVDESTAAGSNGLCGGAANGAAGYVIPASNPFAGNGTGDGCDEVWHYGLRNPYRFSFDRGSGGIYIGDVGQGTWEEIDFATGGTGGLNFGWDICEGAHATGSSAACPLSAATLPILEYPNGSDCAVTGGFVYRGPVSPLDGDYVYGDYCSGEIWIASNSGAGWSTASWRDTGHFISGFGEDEDGDLYLTDLLGGTVLRFDSAEIHGIFADGFEG